MTVVALRRNYSCEAIPEQYGLDGEAEYCVDAASAFMIK